MKFDVAVHYYEPSPYGGKDAVYDTSVSFDTLEDAMRHFMDVLNTPSLEDCVIGLGVRNRTRSTGLIRRDQYGQITINHRGYLSWKI